MKISIIVNNMEMELKQIMPSDMKKLLRKPLAETITGYPQFFCIYPMPNSDKIKFKVEKSNDK